MRHMLTLPLLAALAPAAELHWERVAAPAPALDLGAAGGRAVVRVGSGALLRHGKEGWDPWAPPSPHAAAADRMSVDRDGSVWVLHGEPSWAQRWDGATWAPRVGIPVSGLANLSTDDAGRTWASGLFGTLAVREAGSWRRVQGLEGNLYAVALPSGAWVWTTARGGAVLRLDEAGAVVERRPGLEVWSPWTAALRVDASGAPWSGAAELGARVGGEVTALALGGDRTWVASGDDVLALAEGAVAHVPPQAPLVQLAWVAPGRVYGRAADGAIYVTEEGAVPPLADRTDAWGARVGPGVVHADDLDGDGDADLLHVAPSGGLQVLWDQGGAWVPGRPLVAPGPVSEVTTCDLDGNGLPDVLARGQAVPPEVRPLWLWRNLGRFVEDSARAGLTAAVATDARRAMGRLRCRDLDGDGLVDVYIPQGGIPAERGLYWLRNRGHGWLRPVPLAARGLGTPAYTADVLAADLDTDGHRDFILPSHWGSGHRLLFGTAEGLVDGTVASGLGGTYGTVHGAWLADVVGDARSDLVVASELMQLWRGAGLRFTDVTEEAGLATLAPEGVALGALDGGVDLLSCGAGSCQWFRTEEGRFADRTAALPEVAGTAAPVLADLGGDGDVDVLVPTADGLRIVENLSERLRAAPAVAPASRPLGLARRAAWLHPLRDGVPWSLAGAAWLLGYALTRRGARLGSARPGLVPVAWVGLAAGALLSADLAPVVRAGVAGLAGLLGLGLAGLTRAVQGARAARRIAGYRLLERLGAGGMGTVYVAVSEQGGPPVALKLVHPELLEDEADRALYRTEAELGARVEHPGVVRILGWGEWTVLEAGRARPTAWLAMELLRGQTLRSHLEVRGPLEVGEACAITRDLCAGLAAIHQLDVVHRDVKPSNAMLVPDGRGGGRVVLMDFGAARHVGQRTQGGRSVLGTLAYLAPEQGRGVAPAPQADVYAAGVLLYELLAQRRPFDADDLVSLLAQVYGSEPPPVERPLPEGLEEVLLRALAKDPEQRFRSARALMEALEPFATAVPAPTALRNRAPAAAHPTRPLSLARQVWRYLRGRPQPTAPPEAAAAATETAPREGA